MSNQLQLIKEIVNSALRHFTAVPNQPMEDKPQCPPAYAQINEKDNDAQKLLLSEQKQ